MKITNLCEDYNIRIIETEKGLETEKGIPVWAYLPSAKRFLLDL